LRRRQFSIMLIHKVHFNIMFLLPLLSVYLYKLNNVPNSKVLPVEQRRRIFFLADFECNIEVHECQINQPILR
jgi:hypothetical protein